MRQYHAIIISMSSLSVYHLLPFLNSVHYLDVLFTAYAQLQFFHCDLNALSSTYDHGVQNDEVTKVQI